MATYAIGDVQGCADSLQRLLERLRFDPADDRLWFTGDLVNRGPRSLDALRLVKQLGDRAVVVLGNHDLHLLARDLGVARERSSDTLEELLRAPDRDELIRWLRLQPLLHHEGDWLLVHAGLLPQWSVEQATDLADSLHRELASDRAGDLLTRSGLRGDDELRLAMRALTRLRTCKADGVMNLRFSGPPDQMEPGWRPWFAHDGVWRKGSVRVIFGHWAALGLYRDENVVGLDTGCVWGGSLTAYCLEDQRVVSQPAIESQHG